jgi:hypothetical protein
VSWSGTITDLMVAPAATPSLYAVYTRGGEVQSAAVLA